MHRNVYLWPATSKFSTNLDLAAPYLAQMTLPPVISVARVEKRMFACDTDRETFGSFSSDSKVSVGRKGDLQMLHEPGLTIFHLRCPERASGRIRRGEFEFSSLFGFST